MTSCDNRVIPTVAMLKMCIVLFFSHSDEYGVNNFFLKAS